MENKHPDAPLVLPLSDGHDVNIVGGKAINLARLINDGFNVPDGFVVTTHAFSLGRATPDAMPAEVADAVHGMYRNIGSPAVAVRSSATAEDMADASMAGQYETFLDVQGEEAVLESVAQCWKSIDSPRIRTYLENHGIPLENVAMAVVVQRLVPASKAGVLFTANPQTGSQREVLIEANWGLGETVVSGTVQPDTLVLDRATGALKNYVIADKKEWLQPGTYKTAPVPEELRTVSRLDSKEVLALWKLGIKVMDHFDAPQDIEWAFAEGQLYLLQSRTVTTLEDAETYEQLLSHIRHQLRTAGDAGQGQWVRHNIAETLPHPTPLTWSVIRRFMTGSGGFGAMYKEVGFEPSPAVSKDGFLELIGGRIYMDLSRAPNMFFENFPFTYDLDLLRANPDAAQGPPTIPSGSFFERLGVSRSIQSASVRLRDLSRHCDSKLAEEAFPQFNQYVANEKKTDISALTVAQWSSLWTDREHKVLDLFAPQSLLPSLIVAMAIADLRTFVQEQFWDEDADTLTNYLSAAPAEEAEYEKPDVTLAANQGLFEVAEGSMTVSSWLENFGHRGPEEFDLGAPRWREQPEIVEKMAEHMRGALSPMKRHREMASAARQRIAELKASLSPALCREFDQRLDLVHRYIKFRENGKHCLMLGYDLLRDMVLEAGRRLDIGDGVFLLNLEELNDAMATGIAPLHLIEQRREVRMAQRRLSLPDVISAEEISSLGEVQPVSAQGALDAFVLSGGTCKGPVRIVNSPQQTGDLGRDYVLVCTSTDPNWTPLFVNACGVILERGGTLSHGAVVAREMGVPAVVLAGATRILTEDETVTVDGSRGVVLREADAEQAESLSESESPDPDDIRVEPSRIPPVVGPGERRGATIRNIFLGIWAVFFLLMALAPEMISGVSSSILDTLLLPLVASLGKPATVAIIAGTFAILTMVFQKILTDNRRLVTAKKRAATLQKEAKKLPEDTPRRRALMALAGPVQIRVLMAAFVPLAVLLGPMIMSFLWLPLRVDTSVRNAKPGSMVKVTAVVNGDCESPVTIDVDKPLKLGDTSEPSQEIFLARPSLEEHLLALRKSRSNPTDMPWDQAMAAKSYGGKYIEELQSFLDGPMPADELSWQVLPPMDQSGKWPIKLSVSGGQEVTVYAVLGEGYPPEKREDITIIRGRRQRIDRQVQLWNAESDDAPIQQVQVRYRDPNPVKGEGTFWKPLDWFEPDENTGPIKALFTPWLVLYIAIYVVVMFAAKAVLRIA